MLCRIAIDDALPRLARFFHPTRIEIEGDEADAFGLHEFSQGLPAATITADDDVLLRRHTLHGDLMHLHGAVHPLFGRQATHDGFGILNEEGCDEHGDEHGGQHVLHDIGWQ